MNFAVKLKKRLVKYGGILALGIVAFSVGIVLKDAPATDSFSSGYLTGTGGGLIGVSVAMLLKTRAALKNEEKLRAMRIEEEDERNLQLAYKSGYTSMAVTVVCLYIASFWFAFHDAAMLKVLTTIAGFLMVTHLAAWFWFRSR